MVEPRGGLALGPAGRKTRRSTSAIIATLALSLTSLLAPASTAWASCVSSGTDEYTCSGDFSSGLIVQDNISSSDNTTTSIKVNSLTANAPYITWEPSATNGVDNVMTVTTGSFSVGNSEASLSAVNMSIGNIGSNGAVQQLTINGTFFTAGVTSTVIGISTSGAAGNDGSNSSTEDGGAGGGGSDGGNSYLTSQGSVTASGSGSIAIFASSGGGNGGKGGSSSDLAGGNGGAGGNGTFAQVTSASAGTTVSALGTGAPAVVVSVTSGNGGDGASGATEGGRGGAGGNSPGSASGSSVGLTFGTSGGPLNITTSGTGGIGIELTTTGGNGGNGAHSTLGNGGGAGAGGTGGDILVESFQRNITTAGSQAPAFFLQSVAGQGGNGGSGESFGDGGSGGAGGTGGNIKLSGNTVTQTSGTQSAGVAVYSLGGAGGVGGDGGWFDGGGSGGSSGPAGTLNINIGNTNSSITTTGGESPGVIGQSIGGHAGSSGSSTGIVAFSASGGSAGAGGTASASNGATITTTGDQSPAIAIHSIGGGGGNGGSAFGLYYTSSNDSKAQGGAGGTVNVNNGGALTTSGNDASGIQAESIGGTGGNGGDDGSLIASFGGGASNGADGGTVTVTNKAAIITGAPVSGGPASGPDPVCGTGCSHGISAQSIGGGGGNAGATVGWFSIGGAGGGGGDAGTVTVTNTGANITTNLVESDGILAQSIGGGGGRGSGTISLGAAIAMALGGNGGDGGSGGGVNVTSQDGSQISTAGDNSPGIHAQSVGGGGGNATYSAAASADVEIPSIAVAVGGSGGSGGDAGSLFVTTIDSSYTGTTPNKITTTGSNSPGILGQSIGGGGGNGAFAIGITASGGEGSAGISIALGGAGGSGGTGAGVEILSDAQIQTAGSLSPGLVAQSIGGGGGNAGTAFSGNVSAGSGALAFSLGGSGGDGGNSLSIQVGTQSPGSIVTAGTQSPGIIAQSIGGGGGSGGLSIAGNLTLSSESKGFEAAIGGSGGSGGTSVTGASQPTVLVTSGTAITTNGSDSQGILAQSIGGGGGSGGASISASLDTASSTEFNLSVGGFGGDGGNGGNLSVSSTAPISTSGAQSEGILAQSIGGGGGSGGLAVSGTATLADTTTFSLTIGGFGGGAGTANTVAVTNSSSITTTGTLSDAILAQSIGGSGGRGGNTYEVTPNPNNSDTTGYAIAIGGSGGSGRTGSTVTLSNSGTIMATGLGSDGIMGQSIGGGGGKGATNVELDFSPTSIDVTEIGSYELAVGGSGGSGADAGSVTLSSNTGAITTGSGVATQVLGSTYHGYGIFLQSVGGGGGDAGAASTTGFAIDGGVGLTISVGGSSGETGNGGAVSVTNSAAITTTNYNSHGIFAQSVGGGGGSGATGITDAFDIGSSKGLSFGVGGAGGSGGSVTVTNNAGGNIVVEGDNSIGIYAQSIGGGGGVGQTAIGGSVSVTSSPVSPDLATTVGGATGDGGAGGTVTVTNAATIQTGINASSLGAEMDGILAQSIGGGGGGASLAVGGGVSNSVGLGLGVSTSVGGIGSSGGAGGQVSVTNSGNVATLGDASAGVFAQSVGGGGGNAVSYVGGTVSSTATTGVELSLGNSGGSGGNGGSVMLANSGQVVTGSSATASSLTVRDAPALFAQSVGGGGGTAEIAGALQFGSGTGIALQLGAQSGSGSGGTVQVSNSNALATFNNSSHGIFAQSVGGGGGTAASLGGMGSASSWSAAITLGASGGSGNGGAVTINNSTSAASITTLGAASFALYGQSVGGGGGDAGEATAAGQSTNAGESTANAALTLKLGASNGGSGNGGAVNINQNNGALATGGIGSAAIFAQSIGGGGGRTGAGSIASSGSIVVGGNSKASGDGGAVTVSATGGSILAGANQASFSGVTGAYGIFAQSVGGGGGIAGNVLMGPSTNFGSGLSMGADTTASGNGGTVSVATSTGVSVTTFGNSSVGIFAQSVGGGGGVLGSTAASPTGALIGSGRGSGVAGPVELFLSGDITTSGDSAHGVFAQAAGGSSGSSSTPANVLVAVGDNTAIKVSGAGANGIYAQSSGAGMGTVSVTTGQGSTVQGGAPAVQSGEYDGAGVFINQGTSSTITNAGTIDSVSGSSGVAIRGVDTTLTITNTGTITGQVIGGTVITGDSQITLDNEVGGTVNAGSRIEADLANSGLLTIQGPSAFNQTLITGNLTQSSTGHLLVNVDFDKQNADLFLVGGTASLGGHVVVNSLSTLPQRSVPVLSAGDGLSQQGIVADPSTLFGYGLTQTGNELFVSVTSANFSPSSIGLSRAEQAVANGLQSVWNAGGNSAFGPLFAQLDADASSSGAAYAHDLGQLSPGASPAIAARQPAESQNFANAMLSCPEFSGPTALVTEGGCAWVRIIGRVTNQHASDGIPSFNISNITYQIGGQAQFAPNWFAAGSLAFQSTNLNGSNSTSGSGQSGYGGAAVKWQPGAFYMAFAVSGSYGQYDTSRTVSLPGFTGVASASPVVESIDARVRAAYNFVFDTWYARPYVDLDLIHTRAPGYNESGPTTVSLNVATANQTTFVGTPAVEVGKRIDLQGGMTLRPFAMAGVSVFSNSDWKIQAAFSGAPIGTLPFTTTISEGNVVGRFGAGVQLLGYGNLDLRLQYDGEYGANRISNAGFLTAAWRF